MMTERRKRDRNETETAVCTLQGGRNANNRIIKLFHVRTSYFLHTPHAADEIEEELVF